MQKLSGVQIRIRCNKMILDFLNVVLLPLELDEAVESKNLSVYLRCLTKKNKCFVSV